MVYLPVSNSEYLSPMTATNMHTNISPGSDKPKGPIFTKKVWAWGLWDWGSAAFNAVILTEALRRLKAQTAQRDANARYLAGLLRDVPGIALQARGRRADVQGYYMLAMLVALLKPGSVNGGVIEDGRDLLAKLGHGVRA